MPTDKPRQVLAIGGGGFSVAGRPTPLDDYLLSLPGLECPRLCFVPTASGDDAAYLDRFYTSFAQRRCTLTHLALFQRDRRDLRELLLEQDIIFVGGGNTVNLLAVWRAHGVDMVMREAYQRGVVLAGISAGALCWFEGGTTDSFSDLVPLHDGLGILSGSVCPHYSLDSARQTLYHQAIRDGLKPGLAIDDGAAAHYLDEQLAQTVGEVQGCACHAVAILSGSVEETRLPTRYLSPRSASAESGQGWSVQRVTPESLATMDEVLDLFSTVFEDKESYSHSRPGQAYLERLLAREGVIILAVRDGEQTVGALAAYVLEKFEQERSEFYIYDLAVALSHRRQGIATALIEHLKSLARVRRAWVIFVQADHGDDPAIALYTRLGQREDVLHFDIPPHR